MTFHHIIRKKYVVCDCGFTLVELLVVIAIIGTLAGIAIPLFFQYIDTARVTRAKSEIRMLSQEITSYYLQHNRYPNNLAEIGLGAMLDPWRNPYEYLPIAGTPPGKHRKDHAMVPVNKDYDLYSMGEDGKSQTPFTAKASRDDIVRANDGSYIGLVSQY
ncbi:MAG: type II secretion system protein GspG [Desulfocapsaceae bacterium]|nr:type II secretion system protein GspG [Desulfocapsaceae bacterium]